MKMTAQELVKKYNKTNPGGHFFSSDNLRYFGEDIADMLVEDELREFTTEAGNTYTCHVLFHKQKVPTGLGRRRKTVKVRTFFDIETMRDVGRIRGD
jgi:hypothetical protein